MRHKPKHKPYRILCLILWSHQSWITWEGERFTLKTGELCRKFKVPISRCREYFQYLQKHRYIEDLQIEWGKISATVRLPRPLQKKDS